MRPLYGILCLLTLAGCQQPMFLVRSTLGPKSQDVMTEDVVRHRVDGADRKQEWPWDVTSSLEAPSCPAGTTLRSLRELAAAARLPETEARLRAIDEQAGAIGEEERLGAALNILVEQRGEALAAIVEMRSHAPPPVPAFRWKRTESIILLTEANNGVDCLALEDEGPAFAQELFPGAHAKKDRFRRLIARLPPGLEPFNHRGSDGFHFDDLFTFDDIARRWRDLETWARFQAEMCQEDWDCHGRDDYICAIGIMLHVTQDFYQHSNWIDIVRRFHDSPDAGDYPLWWDLMPCAGLTEDDMARCEAIRRMGALFSIQSRWPAREALLSEMRRSNVELSATKLKGGLQTGAWNRKVAPDPATGKRIEPWYHTHDQLFSRTRALVGELAARQTERTIVTMLGFLDEEHRKALIAHVSHPDP